MSDTAHQETESVVVNTLNWSPTIDNMLATWCDNAKAFEWMHTQAFSLFDKRSRSFMISVNCLTAISGLSNVIAGGYNVNGFQLAWIFGGLSIAVSTLNILQDKLGYVALTNNHMKLASDWSSIKGRIEEVITIPYSGRRDCKTFLKYIRDDIVKATSHGNTMIPDHIRKECYEKFKDIQDFDLPDICGKMEHTKIYVSEPLIVN
jgi:hypothetical protein